MRRRAFIGGTLVSTLALCTASACGDSSSSSDGTDAEPEATSTLPDADIGDSRLMDSSRTVDADVDAHADRKEPTTILSAGEEAFCALKGGAVKCWGSNAFGSLGTKDLAYDSTSRPPQVVPGISFTPTMLNLNWLEGCASDGMQTMCWGDDPSLYANKVSTCTEYGYQFCLATPVDFGAIRQVRVGIENVCALRSSGGVECYGQADSLLGNYDGGYWDIAMQTVSGLDDAVDIEIGSGVGCALKPTGEVFCWGGNGRGTLGQGSLGPDAGINTDPYPIPVVVPGIHAKQIALSASNDACALLQDNTVACWGLSYDNGIGGMLGHNPLEDQPCTIVGALNDESAHCNPTPRVVAGLSDVREIAAGAQTTCAVMMDDTLQCWGDNTEGELGVTPALRTSGNYPSDMRYTPQKNPYLTNVAHVTVGAGTVCAVTWDDRVLCWGGTWLSGNTPLLTANPRPIYTLTPVAPTGL